MEKNIESVFKEMKEEKKQRKTHILSKYYRITVFFSHMKS